MTDIGSSAGEETPSEFKRISYGTATYGSMKSAERIMPTEESANSVIDRVTTEMLQRKRELLPVNNHRARWEAWEIRRNNLLAELRRMNNDLMALINAEQKDSVLREVGKQVRREILSERRKYDRHSNLESRVLVESLFHVQEPDEQEQPIKDSI